MKSALIATSFFFFCFFGKDFLAHFLSHHSVSHQNSPRHELHISFSCCCCCFCFVSLSLYFRLNWQQLLSLLLLTLTFFFSLLLPPTLSGFSASLFRLPRQSVYLFSFSCSVLSMLCIALPSGKKPLPALTATPTRQTHPHVPCTPAPAPAPTPFSHSPTVFYLRFSSLSSSWSPNLLAARKAASCCCCGCFCLLSQNYVAKSS